MSFVLKGPSISLVKTYEFLVSVRKIILRISVLFAQNLPPLDVLSKVRNTDNSESHNSQKFGFTNTQGLRFNFVGCKSSFEFSFPYILTLYGTSLYDSIDLSNFCGRCYLLLIWKDSAIHMHDFAVYVGEGLPFVHNLSLKSLRILIYVFSSSNHIFWTLVFR